MSTAERRPRRTIAPSPLGGRGGGPRPAPRAETITTHAAAQRLAPEWRALWESSADPNPFLQPEWLLSWARLHVPDGRLLLMTLRSGGDLVAIAPMHVSRRAGVRTLLPLGCGPGHELTEVPGIVCASGERRRLLPALVAALAGQPDGWDWARITLSPADGWLEPGWLPAAPRPVSVLHHQTRACVMLPLAATWEAQRALLGRNLRESLRRSRNRLDGAARWSVRTEVHGAAWAASVAELCRLHGLRADVPGRPAHGDWSADPQVAHLLAHAATRLPAGALEIAFLDVEGVPVAAQALLHGGRTTYLLMSGFDPAWWWHGPMTELVGTVARAAIGRGHLRLNLSSGPIASKTRWSRELELHQDFVLVAPRTRSRAAFAGYASIEALHRFHRESRRFRPIRGRQGPDA